MEDNGDVPGTVHDSAESDDLNARLAVAEAKAQRNAELLATVSHEIRTPMGAVISLADLLLGTDLDDTQQSYADTLKQSATSLVTVLNDILDHSKLDAHRFELSAERFNPHDLMNGIGTAYQAAGLEQNLEIIVRTDPDVPHALIADSARIRQILTNMIDNAIKFTESGSVVIALTFRRSKDNAVMLQFSVSDTGIGMSDQVREKLFAPFTQADNKIASKYGGTGLGLSIARQLVQLMKGEISCDSREQHGSTFRFSVECDVSDESVEPSAHRQSPDKPARQPHSDPSSVCILVVEDNRINQMLITTYLNKFGYGYEVACNGFEAVAAAERGQFDLVLMDVQMPEMDGTEATRRIRELDSDAANLPIIALTANAMHGDREAYLAAGMDDYIAKPIIATILYEKINEALAGQLGRKALSA